MSLKVEVTKVHRDAMFGYGTVELEILSDDLKPRHLLTLDVEEIHPFGENKPYLAVRIVPMGGQTTHIKVQL